MDKLRSYALLIVFLASVAFTGTASAYSLSLSSAVGNVGDVVGVELHLQSDEELLAADISVGFDSSILTYTGISWNTAIYELVGVSPEELEINPFLITPNETFPADGKSPILLSIMANRPFLLEQSFHLVTINFVGNKAGTSPASFEFAELYNNNGDLLTGSNEDSSVTINGTTPVPEPSTFLLAGAGIACLLACRRRRL